MTRYFKIVDDDGTSYGRFQGKTPKQAANKAFTAITRKAKNKAHQEGEIFNDEYDCSFTVRECTRGKRGKKMYHYIGKREKLNNPIMVHICDNCGIIQKTIMYKYMNNVKLDKKQYVIEKINYYENELSNLEYGEPLCINI